MLKEILEKKITNLFKMAVVNASFIPFTNTIKLPEPKKVSENEENGSVTYEMKMMFSPKTIKVREDRYVQIEHMRARLSEAFDEITRKLVITGLINNVEYKFEPEHHTATLRFDILTTYDALDVDASFIMNNYVRARDIDSKFLIFMMDETMKTFDNVSLMRNESEFYSRGESGEFKYYVINSYDNLSDLQNMQVEIMETIGDVCDDSVISSTYIDNTQFISLFINKENMMTKFTNEFYYDLVSGEIKRISNPDLYEEEHVNDIFIPPTIPDYEIGSGGSFEVTPEIDEPIVNVPTTDDSNPDEGEIEVPETVVTETNVNEQGDAVTTDEVNN